VGSQRLPNLVRCREDGLILFVQRRVCKFRRLTISSGRLIERFLGRLSLIGSMKLRHNTCEGEEGGYLVRHGANLCRISDRARCLLMPRRTCSKVTPYQVYSRKGVFGRVAAYFGTVKSQGRGTLHLHLLVWLNGTPSSDELTRMFEDDLFKQWVVNYIHANIRAYVHGFESAASVKALPKVTERAYSRPPNPRAPDFEAERAETERQLAQTEQIHTCKPRRCLVTNRQGVLTCK
jgi:Helitron helicase-like domain at N-terminus